MAVGGDIQQLIPLLQVTNRGRVAAQVSFKPSLEALRDRGVEIMPSSDLLLRPREVADVTFFYR